jgi:hypothetical protein
MSGSLIQITSSLIMLLLDLIDTATGLIFKNTLWDHQLIPQSAQSIPRLERSEETLLILMEDMDLDCSIT